MKGSKGEKAGSEAAAGFAPSLTGEYEIEFLRAVERFSKAGIPGGTSDEVPVGLSSKEVIWTRNKACLFHYLPLTARRNAIPLFFVYALINKSYILDLRPGASLIEFLLQQGFEVYLLDWGTPGPEDRNLKLDDYVLEYLPRAVKHVLHHSGEKEISLLGYCLGGLLAVCYAALHPQAPLKNLVLVATPLDFNEKGLLGNWFDPRFFNVDEFVDAFGLIPPEMVDFGTKMLKPLNNFFLAYTGFFDKILDEREIESWLSMNRWVNDGVPFAGEAFRQLIKDLYLGNKLTTGKLVLGGKKVDLTNIKISLLNIIADRDHIALPSQSKRILELVSSADKEQIILPGGHVGLVTGQNARNVLWPTLVSWLGRRSGHLKQK